MQIPAPERSLHARHGVTWRHMLACLPPAGTETLASSAHSQIDLKGGSGFPHGVATLLLGAVRANTVLTSMSLANVQLPADAGPQVATMLAHNTTLTQIDLRGTGLDDAGLDAIGQALSGRPKPCAVDCDHFSISSTVSLGWRAHKQAMETSCDLELLQPGAAKILVSALGQNQTLRDLVLHRPLHYKDVVRAARRSNSRRRS